MSDEKADVPTSSAPDAQAAPRCAGEADPRGHGAAPPRVPAHPGRAGARRARTVSSEQLAELARVNAAKVRKDLSLLGSFGTRGSGYDPGFLISQIDRALGVDENWPVAIVGIGNLGRALTTPPGSPRGGAG